MCWYNSHINRGRVREVEWSMRRLEEHRSFSVTGYKDMERVVTHFWRLDLLPTECIVGRDSLPGQETIECE